MAVQDHPTADNTFTIPGLGKAYVFASVADGDTFPVPMAHPRFAAFIPNQSSPVYSSVEIGALGGSTVELTFQMSTSSGGALLVFGTGI
jgi:hypothetical protein